MNGFSILMFIFSICVFLTGLYMYTGHKLRLLSWKAAFKNININDWKNIGKWTIISSFLILLIAITILIFN